MIEKITTLKTRKRARFERKSELVGSLSSLKFRWVALSILSNPIQSNTTLKQLVVVCCIFLDIITSIVEILLTYNINRNSHDDISDYKFAILRVVESLSG